MEEYWKMELQYKENPVKIALRVVFWIDIGLLRLNTLSILNMPVFVIVVYSRESLISEAKTEPKYLMLMVAPI